MRRCEEVLGAAGATSTQGCGCGVEQQVAEHAGTYRVAVEHPRFNRGRGLSSDALSVLCPALAYQRPSEVRSDIAASTSGASDSAAASIARAAEMYAKSSKPSRPAMPAPSR
jgi:hypothetical protein